MHWKQAEADERAERLRVLGHDVDARVPAGPPSLRELRDDPPDAVVIDLSRLPSQGRDFGIALRMAKGTRQVPLLFLGGDPEKVARVRELLPDATYAGWDEVAESLSRTIADAPEDPVRPSSVFAPYEGVPLVRKLGIKPGSVVSLVDPPDGFEETLGALPDGTVLQRGADACALVLWFATTREEVERGIVEMSRRAREGDLWVLWPKRSSGRTSDLTQPVVRWAGLDRGLVDYKTVSVDETWTGLRFRPRR